MQRGATRDPFVGRQGELDALLGHLAAACQGAGGLVLLGGEPGIGKTRLAEELAAAATARGARVLWGRCYEGEGAPAFWPWVQVLRAAVRAIDAPTIRTDLGPAAADLAQLLPELRALLPELPVPPEPPPEEARFRLFDAVTTFLARATRAQGRPLVLLLDDLQWADGSSLRLLAFLARHLHTLPLLLVGTYRDVEVDRVHPLAPVLADLARVRGGERIILGGLSEEGVSALLADLTPAPTPADETDGGEARRRLSRALGERTGGNPFFLREAVRHLADHGQLGGPVPEQAPDAAALAAQAVLPAGVREVIRRRLARLPEPAERALTLAAVLGRAFGVAELGRVGELSGEALLGVLEEAETAGLIAAVAGTPGRYAFTHDLIRETLYADVPTTRRARLHRQVAAALEGRWGTDPEHVAALAHHFWAGAPAGDADKAVAYARRAGDQALSRFAYEEAADHYQRALQALALGAPDGELRGELLLALGSAQNLAGQFALAKDTYRQAAAHARQQSAPALLAEAALGHGSVIITGVVDAHELELLREALSAIEPGDSLLRVRLLSSMAVAQYYAHAWDQMDASSAEAVAMARRLGDPRALLSALNARHWTLLGPHQARQRRVIAAEQLHLAEATGNRATALRVYEWHILDCLELGDLIAAEGAIEAHARLAEALNSPNGRAYAHSYVILRTLLHGRFAEAERLIVDEMRPPSVRVVELHGRFAEAEGLIGQAFAGGQRLEEGDAPMIFAVRLFALRREQGRLGELEAAAGDFVRRFPALPAWRAAVALIRAEAGDHAAARRELDLLAADGFVSLPRDVTWLTACAALAEVCAILVDVPRAATLYELLRPSTGCVVLLGDAYACYGAVDYFLGLLASTVAGAGGDAARAAAWWERAARHFEAALALHTRLEAPALSARTQHAFAGMLVARGRPEDRERAGSLLEPAVATARGLGMDRLADAAATLRDRLAETAAGERTSPPAYPAGLSGREVEVLRLLAAGKTNKEIADALVLSPATVQSHTIHIYQKLGVRGRADAIAFALRHDLLPEPANA